MSRRSPAWKPPTYPASTRHSFMGVAALYVDDKGPYGHLTPYWYNEARDATTYALDLPVVAHPPCRHWSKLAPLAKPDGTKRLGPLAVGQVRKVGGVLEHPVGSKLFERCGIPLGDLGDPCRPVDEYGGYVIVIGQDQWGHRAQKRTAFYICPKPGTPPVVDLPPIPTCLNQENRIPVERMGKLERRLTPFAAAWWLCQVAQLCGMTEEQREQAFQGGFE